MRVVVVEDDPSIRSLLAIALPLHDIEVVAEAAEIASAVTSIDLTHPDGVVLDLRLQGSSGLEGLAAVKGVARHARIVIFTSEPLGVWKDVALELGADAVVCKSEGAGALAISLLAT